MSLILANIIGFVSTYRKWFAIGSLVLIVVVTTVLWSYCGKSRIEQRIEDRQPVIVETQQGANQAINAAINANADAVAAQKVVNAVRANKQANVTLEAANKNRCLAFPESCK